MLIVSDLDGTLFDNSHRASAIPAVRSNTMNWHEFNALHIYDKPITYRIQMLNLIAAMPGNEVGYLTSRTETFRDSSKAQMNMFKCPPGQLVMRGEHEHRQSAEFKCDALAHMLHGRSDQQFCFIDDDLSVCHAVADAFPKAMIINVPSMCCDYLTRMQAAME